MNIYVVDDSNVIRFLMTKMLKELGYDSIIEAEIVDKAIDRMRFIPPDLIFSDLNMPGKSGMDFLKYVRSTPALSKVPFVMVTTMDDKKIIIDAIHLGLQHYLLKPVEKPTLIAKLNSLSITHGITPPQVKQNADHAPAPASVEPVKNFSAADGAPEGEKTDSDGHSDHLAESTISEIVNQYFLVFDGKSSQTELLKYFQEALGSANAQISKTYSAEQLLDLIRKTVTECLKTRLSTL